MDSNSTEDLRMTTYFYSKLKDFNALVEEAREVDPDAVEELNSQNVDLCSVVDRLYEIIDSAE